MATPILLQFIEKEERRGIRVVRQCGVKFGMLNALLRASASGL
jgi:hypothetical protein